MCIPDNERAPRYLNKEENWKLSCYINFSVEILNASVREIRSKFLVRVAELCFDFINEFHFEKHAKMLNVCFTFDDYFKNDRTKKYGHLGGGCTFIKLFFYA